LEISFSEDLFLCHVVVGKKEKRREILFIDILYDEMHGFSG